MPVVAAPFGLTLGGGTEVMLGCTAVRAFTELYAGLVEVGVGLIPGGGGCMEMAARVSARAPDDPTFDLLQLLRGPFEAIGLAKVATSAEEARDLGYLRPSDTTSMARETLIADAKQIALGLARAGYRPPPPRLIRVAGASAGATLKTALRHLVHAHRASEHDYRGGQQGGPRPVRRRRGRGGPGQRELPARPRARGVPLAVWRGEDPRPHPAHAFDRQTASQLKREHHA